MTAAENIIPFLSRRETTLRILAVDDTRLERAFMEEQIRSLGHDILQASDGREAIEILKNNKNKIDVVLMDRLMPVMDGFATAPEIRQRVSHLPIVMITALEDNESVDRALRRGLLLLRFLHQADHAGDRVVGSCFCNFDSDNAVGIDAPGEHVVTNSFVDGCRFTCDG